MPFSLSLLYKNLIRSIEFRFYLNIKFLFNIYLVKN